MIRYDDIIYPKEFESMAEKIAEIRSHLSSSIYQDGSERDRGDDEIKIQTKGILAELIARECLQSTTHNFSFEPLVEFLNILNPNAPDLILNGKPIDIKHGGRFLNVNHKKHNGWNRPSMYWFIIPHYEGAFKHTPLTAKSYMFDSEEISNWEVRQGGSKYYGIRLPLLVPIEWTFGSFGTEIL